MKVNFIDRDLKNILAIDFRAWMRVDDMVWSDTENIQIFCAEAT